MVENYGRYKSTDHVNHMMVAQYVFPFLWRSIFLDASTEMDVRNCKFYCKKRAENNFPWSVLLKTIEMTSKSSKLRNETTCLWLVVPLEFELSDVMPISMVDKRTDHGKLLSIC